MTIDRVQQTTAQFDSYLGLRGLVFEPQVKADLLAAALGSQFLLFAGPSGTGKSTAAAALADFFAPSERTATIAVESNWETPQDVVGSYSTFAGYFVARSGLDRLRLAINNDNRSPIVILEEANLSPIEGYLNPVVHGLSKPACKEIAWTLHSLDGEARLGSSSDNAPFVGAEIRLGPWPRFMGTINVDHTAIAPARKVSGRACVVLLEPMAESTSLDGVDALWQGVGGEERQEGPEQLLHDPRTALAGVKSSGGLPGLASTLDAATERLTKTLGSNAVSKRDEQRCLMYMAFFREIAAHVPDLELDDIDNAAAENALLHFVLPSLTPQQFGDAVNRYASEEGASLLIQRCHRLAEAGSAEFSYATDFWTALS